MAENSTEEEDTQVTPRSAGIGLIIFGFVLLSIVVFFTIAGQSIMDESYGPANPLTGQSITFLIVSALMIGIGIFLMNFKKLSRKL